MYPEDILPSMVFETKTALPGGRWPFVFDHPAPLWEHDTSHPEGVAFASAYDKLLSEWRQTNRLPADVVPLNRRLGEAAAREMLQVVRPAKMRLGSVKDTGPCAIRAFRRMANAKKVSAFVPTDRWGVQQSGRSVDALLYRKREGRMLVVLVTLKHSDTARQPGRRHDPHSGVKAELRKDKRNLPVSAPPYAHVPSGVIPGFSGDVSVGHLAIVTGTLSPMFAEELNASGGPFSRAASLGSVETALLSLQENLLAYLARVPQTTPKFRRCPPGCCSKVRR